MLHLCHTIIEMFYQLNLDLAFETYFNLVSLPQSS